MYGWDILCGISEVPFEIPHKISYPYIEREDCYSVLKLQELSWLWAHKRFWNTPLCTIMLYKPCYTEVWLDSEL